MKTAIFALGASLIGALAMPTVEIEPRANSKSWAGSNSYFLIGLSEARQDAWINNMASYGAKVVRLWVNSQGSGSCQKGSTITTSIPELEKSIGAYDDTVLDAVDKVLVKLAAKGMKALISPHDAANQFKSGSNDPYWKQYGSGYFYETQDAFDAYDNRLTHVLNYKGKYSGRVWKNYTEAIMAFDIQNEPMATKTAECKGSSPAGANWPCGRALHMRSVLGANNPIKIATGGVGGDISQGCNFMAAAVNCPSIDILSIHRYAGNEAANGGNEWGGAAQSWIDQAKGKLVMVEEWGVRQYKDFANIVTEYAAQANDLSGSGIPWLYWQIVPTKDCSYDPQNDGDDSFSIFQGSSVDIAGPIKKAASTTARQDWTDIVW